MLHSFTIGRICGCGAMNKLQSRYHHAWALHKTKTNKIHRIREIITHTYTYSNGGRKEGMRRHFHQGTSIRWISFIGVILLCSERRFVWSILSTCSDERNIYQLSFSQYQLRLATEKGRKMRFHNSFFLTISWITSQVKRPKRPNSIQIKCCIHSAWMEFDLSFARWFFS